MEQRPSWEAKSPQLIKKFPAFYWSREFITAFTAARRPVPILSKIDPVHAPHPPSLRSTLILSSHQRLRFQVVSFPKVSPLKPCVTLSSHPSQSSWPDHPNNIWWGLQSIKLFLMYSFPLPCYLVPLRPKYPPQYYGIKVMLLSQPHSSKEIL